MLGICHRTSSYPSLNAVQPAGLKALHEAWLQARGSDAVPLASGMPVNVVQAVLSNMALIAFGAAADDARYLVFGTALKLLLGRDPTGKTVAETYPRDIAREVLDSLGRVRRERQPLFFRREFRVLNREFGYHRLLLPLRDTAGRISHAALGIYPLQPELRHASQWQSAVAALEEEQLGQAGTAAQWHVALAEPFGIAPMPSPNGDVWLV
jgi:hypothetical protein